MGHVYVKVKILSLDLTASEEVELMVDSGSTYTWVSEQVLERLGIKKERDKEFKTIEGRLPRRNTGMGVVELMGERAPTILVFAQEGDAKVLGVHALEGLGFEFDPVKRELKKVEAILAV